MRRKVPAGALSALLVATSTPVPALAENLEGAAQPVLEQGNQQAEAVDAGTSSEQAVEESVQQEGSAADYDAASAGIARGDATPDAANASDAAKASGATEAHAAKTSAEQRAQADAPASPVQELSTDDGTQPAPSAANGRAAGDSYANEAPSHEASDFVGIYGMISYYYDNGSSTGSVAIPNADAIASIGEPVHKASGGWTVTVTLRSDLTANQLGVPSWNVSDPANKHIDVDNSKLTIEFSTDSDTDGSWSCFGAARASIKFTTEKPAQAPAFDLKKVVGDVLSYTIDAGSLKPKKYGMNTGEIPASMIDSISAPVRNAQGGWDITVTLKPGTAADYNVPEGYLRGFAADEMVIDSSAEAKMQFTVSTVDANATTWQCHAKGKAAFTFIHQETPAAPAAPAAPDVAAIQGAASYTLRNADGSEAFSTRVSIPEDAIESVGSVYQADDGNYAVDVTLAAKKTPADYGIEPPAFYDTAYELDQDASTLTMTLEYVDGAWTYTWPSVIQLVFAPVAGPTFDMSEQVNKVGNIAYVVYDENGKQEYSGSATLSKLGGMDKVTGVGKPQQQDNGTWAVDVTLADDTLASLNQTDVPSYMLKHDKGAYVLDLKASDLTGTYRTTGSGTTYTIFGNDRPTFVFRYQEPQEPQAPAFDISNELNVYGTVNYKVNKADGSSYDNGTHLVSADNIANVGTPYQTEDGCWAVDVVLKGDPAPEDYAVPNWVLGDAGYEFDANASDLTLTFRTLTPEGTTWYCSGNDRALLVFAEKTEGENPGTTVPGEDVDTGDDAENPEGGEDVKGPSDGEKPESASDNAAEWDADKQNAAKQDAAKRRDVGDAPAQKGEDKLAQTGDPLDGLVAVAAAGTITLVAGIELKRRNEHDAR